MERLYTLYHFLLSQTETTFLRYLYSQIDWESRLVVIEGARGVGKTTMILQRIKLSGEIGTSLYVDAGHRYFSSNSLYDFVEAFYKNGGKCIYIDEVHKYETWSREVKMMYDYLPELKIVLTGSSLLSIKKGVDADLSRRAIEYTLHGLSFREFLFLSEGISVPHFSLEDIVAGKVDISGTVKFPIPLFHKFLKMGDYPFFLIDNYQIRLNNVVNQTLEVDIPQYARMNVSTVVKLKKLLNIISQSVPFKPNFSEIARSLEVDRATASTYMTYMEKSGLIRQLHTADTGMKILEKVDKVYLANTSLVYALADNIPEIGNVRETFFFAQTSVCHTVASADANGDFRIGDYTFEVGGHSKKQKQINGIPNSFVVKDDIDFPGYRTLPLWHFGLMY